MPPVDEPLAAREVRTRHEPPVAHEAQAQTRHEPPVAREVSAVLGLCLAGGLPVSHPCEQGRPYSRKAYSLSYGLPPPYSRLAGSDWSE